MFNFTYINFKIVTHGERGRERESRRMFLPRVHGPDGYSKQDWARLRPWTRNFILLRYTNIIVMLQFLRIAYMTVLFSLMAWEHSMFIT